MKEDDNIIEPQEEQGLDSVQETQAEPAADAVASILERLGVSESVATSARAILDTIEAGKTPGENFVKLIVNALNHDEDVKNAEAAGYVRGRNEAIDAATTLNDNQQPTPVNFPVYRKRSFWE